MKRVTLDNLTAKNFMGIQDISVDFTELNDIYGANASGKTTLVNAFLFLLFGKDIQGRSDFQVRPVDLNGQMVDNIDIEVSGTLSVRSSDEDYTVILKKIQKQNWVTKRGSSAPTFQGNVNSYEVNGFPASQKDFDAKVASIIGEQIFRLLTNPKTFAAMKWQDQREILLMFVSGITDADIINTHPTEYTLIADDVLEAGAEKAKEKHVGIMKKLKEDQKLYPARIDEASKAIVEVDVTALETEKAEVEKQLADIRQERSALGASLTGIEALTQEIMSVGAEMAKLEQAAQEEAMKSFYASKKAYDDAAVELETLELQKNRTSSALDIARSALQMNENDLARTWQKYKEVKARTLPETDTICPTCGREFEPDKVDEIRRVFAEKKAADKKAVRIAGDKLNEAIVNARPAVERMEKELAEMQKTIIEKSEHVMALKAIMETAPRSANMDGSEAYQKGKQRLEELKAKLSSLDTGEGQKRVLNDAERDALARLDTINAGLADAKANRRAEERVAELKAAQIECSQKVADQEAILYQLECFIRAKMDMLSDRINSHFRHVRFKLFERQINGAIRETCVMQIKSNGSYVDYPNANHAAQIQGGLDVIHALSELYDVTAPVFIDNRESITEIPDIGTQVINLIVSPEDKTLRIENR